MERIYRMVQANEYVIGVDLGGTKVATALIERSGRVVRRTRFETSGLRTSEEVIDCLVRSVQEVRGELPVSGIGVASPGAVDTRRGIIKNGTNLPGWVDIPLRDALSDRLGTAVTVVNDANAAAWGEYYAGAGKGSQTMVYVTLSTGIGAGLVLDGRLFLGSTNFAGELGHTVVNPDGPVCSCGRPGCWEAYASGTSIARIGMEAAAGRDSLMADLALREGVPFGARHVFEAARLSDAAACETIELVIRYMALGLMNIVHTFNPDCIVIGGGVSKAGGELFLPLTAKTREEVMEPYRDTYRILPATLGDDAGVVGAAALCL